jgi:hypothetical protein
MHHHLVASLRAGRSHLKGTAATSAKAGFLTFEAPQSAMQTALKSSKASKRPQPDTWEPKPDTPDEVAPEIGTGAAPMENVSEFITREGGEGGPGKIPMKDEQRNNVKEETKPGIKDSGEKTARGEKQGAGEQKQTGDLGPASFGGSHKLDYSR